MNNSFTMNLEEVPIVVVLAAAAPYTNQKSHTRAKSAVYLKPFNPTTGTIMD